MIHARGYAPVIIILLRAAAGAVFLLCAGQFVSGCGKKADPFLPLQVAPKQVQQLKAHVRPGAIVLSWKAPRENTNDTPLQDLAGFRIYRSEVRREDYCPGCPRRFDRIFDYSFRNPVEDRSLLYYRDTAVSSGMQYAYKLHSYNAGGIEGPSSRIADLLFDVPPAPPGGLAVARRHRLLILSWSPVHRLIDGRTTDDIAGYNIYRSKKPGLSGYDPLNPSLLQEPRFEDVPDADDTTYYYMVRTVRRVDGTLIEGPPSTEAAVAYMDTTPPGRPRWLTAVPIEHGILLKWMPKAEKDFAGFNLYRRGPSDTGFMKLHDGMIEGNSWVDTTVRIGTTYQYGVTAVDLSSMENESEMSETVKVKYIIE